MKIDVHGEKRCWHSREAERLLDAIVKGEFEKVKFKRIPRDQCYDCKGYMINCVEYKR